MADRKRLNTQIDTAMADVLQRWQDEWGKTESEIVRVALAIGLQSLRNDPTPLGPRPLTPDEMSPPDVDEQVKKIRSMEPPPKPHHAHVVTPTGKKAKGLKVDEDPLAKPASEVQLQKNLRDAQNATKRGRLRSDPKE